MIDPASLVSAILPQILDYLTKPGLKDKYLESTEMLWKKLSKKIKDRENSGVLIINDILQDPTDEFNQAALRLEIKKILNQEPEFLTEVRELLVSELDTSNISQYYSAFLICSDFIHDSQSKTISLIKIIDKITTKLERTIKVWVYLSLRNLRGLHEVRISYVNSDGEELDLLTGEYYYDTNGKSQYISPLDILGNIEDTTLIFKAYIDNHLIAESSLDVHS